VREAKQMDITAQSPEQFAQLVKSSYPFHPAIKDLYARFRENQGFQQTRALIRLMRIIAAGLWQTGEADKKYLISVHDIDLNDAGTLSEVRQINWVRLFWNEVFRNSELEMGAGRDRCLKIGELLPKIWTGT